MAQLRLPVVRRALALAALCGAALAAILAAAATVSAQGPNDHDLPILPGPPALAMRGGGETFADGAQLIPGDGTPGALTADGQLTVNDADGLFEIRAHLIGQDGADPAIHVHDQSGALVYEYNLLLSCPHADTCRIVSDVFVEFEAGGTWLVELHHEGGQESGRLSEWQIEVYREGTTLGNIDMPPFPAPPAVAARGDGSLMPDGVHMIPMTLSEGAAVDDQGVLLFSDDDGVFELRAYFVAPNGAEATARVYPADSQEPLYEYQMIVACPTQPLCRVATDLVLHLGSGGTWGIALEHIDGVIYDWQVELYRDEPLGLPTTGTGGLLDDDGNAREIGLIALATLGVAGLALFVALALRRTRAALLAAALAALALIAALAVPTALPGGSASAQTPEDDEALTALQRTHIAAEIPEQYNEPFQLRWGGGSLYQLKQRLATMNCIVDTVWVHQNDQWHGYNQYQVPSTLNTQFIETYSEFIPAGNLYASCYDICEFNYYDAPRTEPCVSLETVRQQNFYNAFKYPIDQNNPCTSFDSRVQANVTPVMPLYPDVCLIRQEAPGIKASVFNPINRLSNALYPYFPSVVVSYTKPTLSENDKVYVLGDEIHELCHTNQYWQFIQNLQPDNIRRSDISSTEIWRTTQAGREFINLVGFTQNANGEWILPDNTYNNIYAVSPTELAAELCSMYFIDAMGEVSEYNSLIYDKDAGYQWRETTIDFDPSPYLTPEVRQWIETYIVLPN